MNIKSRLDKVQKEMDSDSFSIIPKKERFLVISGYTEEEREVKIYERLTELSKKFGDFDENVLTVVGIRKFSKGAPQTFLAA